ncbi:hypothetical protein M404DRAFT_870046 [Pisolithus tinctorius Marx 270]|uniref:Uncharacterized protein n=1 Tax=Pisolithus tinctorius Marx 270 TaxID=870435 RepID=A0A0C3PQ54_PISTI|nr:hypothetical protein M404DRAFT_870046 [Pisolithus tinctorius Marx 270]
MPAMVMDTKRIQIVSQRDTWAVTFADEGQVVGGYRNGDIRRWKIEDGQQQGPTVRASDTVRSIVVSQDGRWMVSGDKGTKAIVWNATTHEKVLEFTENTNSVLGIDISSDCTKVASVDYSKVWIFSITSGVRLLPPLRHPFVTGVKFSPDGSHIATASETHGFRVYSTHNGNILFDSGEKGSTGSTLGTQLAWSSDGQQLFIAKKGKITCFDLSNSVSSEWSIHGSQSLVYIASNGRFIACAAGSSVSLWDCVSHKQINSIITHTSQISCVALSPSGGYLACGSDRNITVHNLRHVLPPEYFDCGPLRVSQLPLVQVNHETLKSWTREDLTNTEMLLSEELRSAPSPSHCVLASRALIRVRLKHLALAMEDVKQSLQVQPSPIGHIAMAVTLLCQGDRKGALSYSCV